MSQDGFGTRTLTFDPQSGEAVEVLSFAAPLAALPDFAAAVGERVARVARVRHTMYARARRIDRPSPKRLLLFSDHVAGWRLSDVLDAVERQRWMLDISAVLALLRQLIPAVALFSRHQRDAAIGTIGPERLILTPQGRLVIAEYVLAPGLEKLQYSRERVWREFRVAMPPSASPAKVPPAADVIGIGVVALSLLIGRRLKDDEFLVALGDLCESIEETNGSRTKKLSSAFASWLARALQFEGDASFETTQETQVAFEEMLAKESSYVTSSAQLNNFVVAYERLVGGPPPAAPMPPASAAGRDVRAGDGRTPSAGTSLAQLVTAEAPPAAEPPARSSVSDLMADLVAGPVGPPAFDAPGAPRAHGARSARSAPAAPGAPGAPGAPDAPGAPAAPGAPDASGAPVASSAPGARNALGATGERGSDSAPGWRRHLVAALTALVLAEAAVIGWLIRGDASTPLGHGELVVQSRPASARVTIDGDEHGLTPYTTELAAGSHILEVRVGRSEPRVIPIVIRAGVQTGLYVELQSVATVGGLEVRTDPPKATVTVGGQDRGVTPLVLRDLPPGDVDVVVRLNGREVRHTVRIEPGITSQLVVPLGR